MPSDSISAYDSSASKYTAGPTIEQQKRAAQPRGALPVQGDTLETPQERSDRLNPMKVAGSDGITQAERAVKIARAGRFVFFSVALPPFLLIYSIPKLLLSKVLPAVVALFEQRFVQIKDLMQQMKRWVVGNVATSLRNVFGKINWALRGIEGMGASALYFIRHSIQTILKIPSLPGKVAYQTLKMLTDGVAAKYRALVDAVKESAAAAANRMIAKMKEQVQGLVQSVTQPVTQWMIPKIKSVQFSIEHGFKLAREGVERVSRRGVEALEPLLKTAQDSAVAVHAAVAKVVENVVQPAINLLVPLQQACKKSLAFGFRFFQAKPFQRLASIHRKVYGILTGFVSAIGEKFGSAKQKYQQMFGKFARGVRRAFPLVRPLIDETNEVYERWAAFFKRGWNAFTGFVQGFYHRFERQLSPLKNGAMRLGRMAIDPLKEKVGKPAAYLSIVMKPVMKLALKSLKWGALLSIGCGLVFKHWFKLLFELGEELVHWTRKNPEGSASSQK